VANTTLKFLTVRVDDHWFGIPVVQIIEVLHLVAFEEVPARRADIVGLITVRDEVMQLIDFRRLYSPNELRLHLDTPVIAIRTSRGPLALLFDEADEVEDIGESQLMESHNAQQFLYVDRVAQRSGKLLLLLDTERMGKELSQMPA
jgi:purine-binding chemotaxis protein CheW